MKQQNVKIPRHYTYFRIVLPVIVTFFMFFVALYAIILPGYRQSLEERKLETVREITNAAWSVLGHYAQLEQNGTLSTEDAKHNAIEELRMFRYGQDMKDYVWILDLRPFMIMHPYRTDLENKPIRDFTDPHGKHLFVDMVDVVNEKGEGFVRYMWQWKDDPSRIEPKVSFVKEFTQWGWIIGSGMYVDDVAAEIAGMTRRVSVIATVILISVLVLLSIVIYQSVKIDRSRLRSEQALRVSEKKYRELTDMLPIIVFEIDNEKNVTFLNQHAYEMLGVSKGKISRDINFLDYIHPDDHTEVLSNLARKYNGETSGISEYRMLRQDGAVLNVLVRSLPLMQNGKISGLRGIIIDITDKKRAEQELQASENKYRELVENANSIILRYDREGTITFFNEYAEEFFGYREEEIIGKNVIDTIVPEQDSAGYNLREMLEDIYRRPNDYKNFENENIRKNGERVWVSWANRAIMDENGELKEILSIGNDITERKTAEQALHESEARLRSIFRASPVGICLLESRIIKSVNNQILKMFGYSSDELIDKNTRMLYFDDEEYERVGREVYQQVERTGIGTNVTKFKCKDGRALDIQLSCSPNDPSNPKGLLTFILLDITERNKLEKQLLQSQKMETVGRLAGGVAHDFNNLLTVISGNAEIALMGLSPDGNEYDYVDEIKRTAERAANLTRQLLTFSKQQVVEPRLLNLNDTLLGMDKMLRRLIGEHIEFKTVVAEDLWSIKIDPSQIEQVLTNLVVNSCDAMPEGGKLTIETANRMLDDRYAREHVDVIPGEYVMLVVSDTGTGMNETVLSHIFDPFYTTKESGKGTGLGMSTCYGIVSQNGGTIWIYSEPGIGTTIKIYLPRAVGVSTEKHHLPEVIDFPKGSETILVAEDEPGVRKMVERFLSSNGYTVLIAGNGDEALRIAEQHNPGSIQMLLTDVVMPKMNGKILSDSVLRLHPDIKVLFMSGYTDDSIANYNIFSDSITLLQKPFTHQQLMEKIHTLLDSPE